MLLTAERTEITLDRIYQVWIEYCEKYDKENINGYRYLYFKKDNFGEFCDYAKNSGFIII